VIVARHGAPLLLGVGEDGMYAASDTAALLQVTRKVIYLEDGDLAELRLDGYRIVRPDGAPVEREMHLSSLSADAVELGQYRHYMQKEIFEQPQALANTLEIIAGGGTVSPQLFGSAAPETLSGVRQVLIIACGTSYHAGLVARYWLESIARVPCSVEIASEYRYRESVPDPGHAGGGDLAIGRNRRHPGRAQACARTGHDAHAGDLQRARIGDRAGSRPALHHPRRARDRRRLDQGLHHPARRARPAHAGARQALRPPRRRRRISAIWARCATCRRRAEGARPRTRNRSLGAALRLQAACAFPRPRPHWPIAMEGALKLKEISYIHAEAYAAGELKHGPLALVDKDMPVIAIAPADELLEKLKSNLQEVRARGGELYVFADAGSEIPESEGVHILHMPEHYGMLSPPCST
jgi:glutamine---fructose-6-phosphate transaminase (isomerizing)